MQEKRDSFARSAPRNDKNLSFSASCSACLLFYLRGNQPRRAQACPTQLFPYTGIAAPWITRASSEHKNRMTRAISSGLGHFEKSASGMAFRFTAVSMMLGKTEFTLMLKGFTSAASESIKASAAAFDAAYSAPP